MRTALCLVAVLAVSCRTTESSAGSAAPAASTAPAAPAAPAQQARSKMAFDMSLPAPAGTFPEWIDDSADPCQDFFQFACGGWLKANEIPADQSRWGQFTLMQYRNLDVLKALLEEVQQGKAPEGTPYAAKLKDFYGSCMDEAALDKGLPALKAELKPIDGIKDIKGLSNAIVKLEVRNWDAPFRFDPNQDAKDATLMIAEADQGGLGLPERDYYLSEEPKMKEIRQQYLAYLETVFGLLGDKKPADTAKSVLELETALATASMPIVDRRDPQKMYHRVERAGLKKAAPSLDWDKLFTALNLKDVTQVNVTHPPFFEAMEKLMHSTPLPTWRAYLTVRVIDQVTPALPKTFRDAEFAFSSKALTGATEELPRWRKCVQYTDKQIGEALAVPFVNKTFGTEGKAQTHAIVKAIELSFEENLKTLAWMDEPTKERAREKLHQIVNKIGYPDKWRSYDGLKTSGTNYLANWVAADEFNNAYRIAMIGKPIDRARWLMTPPTVNAYYNPPMNEIVFPAGILQTPFYDKAAVAPVNFGAIGLVVGHEITHGFDDEGRQYDAKGNLSQWWTDASDAAFRERAKCVESQYGGHVVIDDKKINGALTLGENVADMGGLKISYQAMMAARGTGGSGVQEKVRFTPEQQFFIGYAHAWCSKTRPANTRTRLATDPHSPPEWRVNVPMQNFAPFAKAFSCKPGDRMALPAAKRCEVW